MTVHREQSVKKEYQQDAIIYMFIVNSRCWLLTTLSTCFGHLYAHHQEKRPRVTAYGVYLLVVLNVAGCGSVMLRWGCEHCEGCCSSCNLHRFGTEVFNPLWTKRIWVMEGRSPYRAVNTLHFGYKTQSVNDVSGERYCLFWNPYKTHKFNVISMQNFWIVKVGGTYSNQ